MDLSKLSEADLQAVASGDMSKVSDEGLQHLSGGEVPAPTEPEHHGALSYVTSALDELGGGVRTGLAHAASNIPGLENLHQEGDWKAAAKGLAPNSSELMNRVGVPEGAHLSDLLSKLYVEKGQGHMIGFPEKGGALDPSVRGTVGLGLDIATDPLTYLTFGGSAAAKAGKLEKVAQAAAHPVETALTHGGEKFYKSAFTRPDAAVAKMDKVPFSDVLWRNGAPTGSARSVANKAQDIMEALQQNKTDLLKAAENKGAVPNMVNATAPARDYLSELEKIGNPDMQSFRDALRDRIGNITSETKGSFIPQKPQTIQDAVTFHPLEDVKIDYGKPSLQNLPYKNGLNTYHAPDPVPIFAPETKLKFSKEAQEIRPEIQASPLVPREPTSLSQLDKWKSDTYNAQPSSSWDVFKKTPQGSKGDAAIAKGYRNEIERSVDKALPDRAGELAKTNADWGSLLTGAGTLDKDALRGENKHLFTSVDPMVHALGKASGGSEGGWMTLALKKLADLYKTTTLRTNLGKGMNRLGQTPGVAPVIQRQIVNSQSPWSSMAQEKK